MKLTNEAVQRLEAELTELLEHEAPRVRKMVEEAKSAGDNSQNPDYFLAAEEEANLLARIKRTQDALAAHHSIAGVELDTSSVQPGLYVDLDFGDGVETFYVGSIAAAGGSVPVLTPSSKVGLAVIGSKVGDVCDGVEVLDIRTEA